MTANSPPLHGIRVVDLSRVLAGPYATMLMGDMGADVVKVERPDGGDDTRRFGPPYVEGVSTYYLSINRSKRSVVLDLKHPDGQAVLWRLVEWADVLVENFRPGTLAKLGFDYEACAARNPRLVYCSVSAFGHAGLPEWSRRPGYDVILQGMGGIPSLTGPPDGAPFKSGASQADVVSGMNAFQGVLLALISRERSGVGQRVDISMLEGQVAQLTYLSSAWLNTGLEPPRVGNRHLSIAPYCSYRAADGWLNVGVANEALWARFCAAVGRAALRDDPRFATNDLRVANVDALDAELAQVFAERTVDAWVGLFDAAGIPAGPVLTVPQVMCHPQLAARDMVVAMEHPDIGEVRSVGPPMRLEGTPARPVRWPPRLGEHTAEVLGEIGFDRSEITAFQRAGAFGNETLRGFSDSDEV